MTTFHSSNDPVDSDQPIDPHDQEAREWLENVYQGDTVRQLSVRSVVTGMLIGGVMSISNLYVGLKTGWGLGVTITACIVAYAVFKALETVIPAYRRDPFTILENYTMSSAASAAGYMSSAGLVSAIPALYLATGERLPWHVMMLWLAAVSFLGVFLAIPLKRQFINIDKLPFPTGTATAETLRSLHTTGAEAMQKARALLFAGVLGSMVAVWKEAFPAIGGWLMERGKYPSDRIGKALQDWAIPTEFPLVPFYSDAKQWLEKYTVGFEGSLIMVAAGAIMGIRVGVSLLIGAIVYWVILGNWLLGLDGNTLQSGWGKAGINTWILWPATAMMVSSGLLAFVLRWRTVLRAFRGLATIVGQSARSSDPLERIEVPGSWFVAGSLVSGFACVVLAYLFFEISWGMGILAVLLTFVLSIVAARATGETDVTPIGAMGKITQLTYGAIAPEAIKVNLMTASITAGAASHSADLLTDLKAGYLLGGNPRKQTISQLFGVIAGTLICVPVYSIITQSEQLGGKELPAPAAQVWAGVAVMLSKGWDGLPEHAATAMLIGALVGAAITLAETYAPRRMQKWVPSAIGLGIAGVVPAFNSISMFVGALLAWMVAKGSPRVSDKYTVAVSSGLIAGESLTGVVVKLWGALPGMFSAVWQQVIAKWNAWLS